MKNRVKKILPLLLLAWPYLCVIPIGLMDHEVLSAIGMGIYIALTVLIYIGNILNVCLDKSEDACRRLAFWGMLLKIVHIPFYVLVFVIGVLMLLTMVVPALVFVTPFVIAALFVLDFFLMITSSFYGGSALIRACRRGHVSKRFTVIHIILHCFFVTDVISAIIVYCKLRKVKKREQ